MGKPINQYTIFFSSLRWQNKGTTLGLILRTLFPPIAKSVTTLYIITSTVQWYESSFRGTLASISTRFKNTPAKRRSAILIFKNRTVHAISYSPCGHVVNASYDIQKHCIRHRWPCTFYQRHVERALHKWRDVGRFDDITSE